MPPGGDERGGDPHREPEALPGRGCCCEPATAAPTTAMPSRPATRATALLTPLAIPASLSPASASTVAVSGATIIERPSEKTSSGGRSSVQYEKPGPSRAIAAAAPAAAIERPDAHEERAARTASTAVPTRGESRNITTVIGSSARPLSSARVARDLLQEEHEEERQRREAGVDRAASRGWRTRSCAGGRAAAAASAAARGAPRARTATSRTTPPTSATTISGSPKPRCGASISANTGPASPSAQRHGADDVDARPRARLRTRLGTA